VALKGANVKIEPIAISYPKLKLILRPAE
jgi:hypothetical protein